MSIHPLDTQAKQVAANYKKLEQELVAIIAKIDRQKIFYKLGYNSLFSYTTKHLKLSAAVTCNISAVVRKSYEVPQLQQKVVSGEISLSNARKLTPVITQKNHEKWLEVAKHKNQKQVEREVSLAKPSVAVPEKTKYIPWNEKTPEKVEVKKNVPRIKLELGVSEKLMLKLRRCQDLESQRTKKAINLESCLEQLVNLYLEKKDPLKKAQRQKLRRKLDAQASVSDRHQKTKSNIKRRAIPAKIKHQVQLRDQSQCTFKDSLGKRCSQKRFLEIHHIIPLRMGGSDDLKNLRLLCHGHHKTVHANERL